MSERTTLDRIRAALAALFASESRVVLAVSGGADSMVLLHAANEVRPPRQRVVVATFDHATGPASEAAATLVRRVGAASGIDVEHARAAQPARTEAAWRAQRWAFLREVAEKHRGVVTTAHTRDDQVETVVMRVLRHAGVRGLAGLYAKSPVARPFLEIGRGDLREYASRCGVEWVSDPGNASHAHLRNRVRLDLLPALRLVRPAFETEMLRLAREAASVRLHVDEHARALVRRHGAGEVEVQLTEWLVADEPSAALAWQSLVQLAGTALDRRGTARLVRFGQGQRVGARVPLSGGYQAERHLHSIVIRRTPRHLREPTWFQTSSPSVYGEWRFHPVSGATIRQSLVGDPWVAFLPADGSLQVRAWRDGDRMVVDHQGRRRRVKRFFADRRIVAPDREGWPVVLLDNEIVWIPGIRRGPAATVRSGRPAICIVCERDNG